MGKELVIRISGDVEDYKAALKRVEKETEALDEALTKVSVASGVAFAALTAGVYKSVEALNVEARSLVEVNQALQNQGLYTDALAKSYRDVAEAIESKTGVDADAISSAQATAQTIIGRTALTEALTRATVDFAVQTKTAMPAAFEVVARGIQGNVRGLQAYGIHIEEGLTKQERYARIVEILRQRYDGAAEAVANTTGSTIKLDAAFGNLVKKIGAQFAPTFDKLVGSLTSFLQYIEKSPEILNFAGALGTAGIAVTGLLTSFALATKWFLAVRSAMIAAGLAAEGAAVGFRVLAGSTGIGLLIVAVTELYLHWETVWPIMQKTFITAGGTILEVALGIGKAIKSAFTLDVSGFNDGINQVLESYKTARALAEKAVPKGVNYGVQFGPAVPGAQDPGKDAAARKAEAEQRAQEARAAATRKAQAEVIIFENAKVSKDLIDLKKEEAQTLAQIEEEKNANIRGILQQHLEEVRNLQIEQIAQDKERRAILNEELLAGNEEFQQLTEAQRLDFLARNQQIVEQGILTEKTAKERAVLDQLKIDTDARNKFLLEQQKYGTTYALLNKAMHSEIYQGTKQAFGELAALQQSSNETLKGIGKAAAIANIIIKTAESAMAIYAGFSTIPIIGPTLGVAGAAAAIAFGAEQVSRVNAAAEGALVEGGIPGVDSVPYMLQRQELVAPRQNFEEVIGSVRAAREAENFLAPARGNEEQTAVLRSIDEKLSNSPAASPTIVVQGDVLADENYIDRLVDKISDRLLYGNSKLLIPGVTV